MNKLRSAFFGLGEVRSPDDHTAFNWWHSSDHMAENLAAPGVFYSRRWVATPALAQARLAAAPEVAPSQYLFCYFMGEPAGQAVADFSTVGLQTRGLGRFERAHIHQAGHFTFLNAMVNERVVISAEALPYRPSRGVFVNIADLSDLGMKETLLNWYEGVHFPDMLGVNGVTGVYSFWAWSPSAASRLANPPGRFVHLYFLDQDPLSVVDDLRRRIPEWKANGRMLDMSGWTKTVMLGAFEGINLDRTNWPAS